MGGVLKARDAQLPASHRLFSTLVFQRGGQDGQQLNEDDEDVTIPQIDVSMLEELDVIRPEEHDGGWLESDDIDEF